MSLWDSENEQEWLANLDRYENEHLQNVHRMELDNLISSTTYEEIRNMDFPRVRNYLISFYEWKYRERFMAKKIRDLDSMNSDEIIRLVHIITDPINSDEDILTAASSFKGVSLKGATTWMAALYPDRFGGVDKFVIRELLSSNLLRNDEIIHSLTEDGMVSLSAALHIENLFREKADHLNHLFHTDFWNPRKIDKALFSHR